MVSKRSREELSAGSLVSVFAIRGLKIKKVGSNHFTGVSTRDGIIGERREPAQWFQRVIFPSIIDNNNIILIIIL